MNLQSCELDLELSHVWRAEKLSHHLQYHRTKVKQKEWEESKKKFVLIFSSLSCRSIAYFFSSLRRLIVSKPRKKKRHSKERKKSKLKFVVRESEQVEPKKQL
jgi:hypothetical protein